MAASAHMPKMLGWCASQSSAILVSCCPGVLHEVHVFTLGCAVGGVLPLVGGSTHREGLVDVCSGMEYLPVDVKTFGIHEASVLCRQMELGPGCWLKMQTVSLPSCIPSLAAGFPVSAAEDLGIDILREVELLPDRVVVVACAGIEQALAECSISVRAAEPHVDLAAVQCTGE